MRFDLKFSVICFLILSLQGCFLASKPVFKDPKRDGVSLALIYIDMSDAPSNAQWVQAKLVKPRNAKFKYYRFGFVKTKDMGYINHNQFVVPGIYKFTSFGGNAKNFLANAVYQYEFPKQGRGLGTMKVKNQGIYFAGSYKYVKVKTGFFQKKKFDIKRVKYPSEKEVLSRFLAHMDDGKWKNMVEKRLREIE